jgi:threonine dehydrogenase-like Zn-dependent dehydrogenase
VKALRFDRKPAKYAAAFVAGSLRPGRGAAWGPLDLVDDDAPDLPSADWVRLAPRLSGICGSDLSTIDGRASRYFEPIVSFPFTPGHEVVADVVGASPTSAPRRVVVVPVLSCITRGVTPVCSGCAVGSINRCERVAFGHLEPGLQSGFCADTGGGWSTTMVAHTSQLVDVPDDLADEAAVIVEPTACAVHAAKRYDGSHTAIIGAGTLGLLTLAAITSRRRAESLGDAPVVVTAKHAEQRRLAKELGADVVCEPDELPRWVRRLSGSLAVGNQLTNGFPHVVDCVGSSDSIDQALKIAAPGGNVLLVGMPAKVSLELTGLWHRETSLRGCYAYEHADFVTAMRLVREFDLGRLVSATYPLRDYRDALEHAATAGRRGAVKIAFDLRNEKGR